MKISNFKFQFSNFEKGFTVIELLLYMSLMVVFLTVISQIFITSLNNQLEVQSTSVIEQDGRYILSRINYDIARAINISDPNSSGSVSSTLNIQIPSGFVTYFVSSGKLYISDASGTNQLSNTHISVSDLLFERRGNNWGKPVITSTFRLTGDVYMPGKGYESKDFKRTMGAR